MAKVAALGELLVDFTVQGADDSKWPLLQAQPGGAPANFLVALSRYGMDTALIAKVGDDAFGDLLIRTLKREGVDTHAIIRDGSAFTTLAFVTLDEKGDREFSFARKPGADTCLVWEEVDAEIIGSSDVFHFGSLSLTHEPSRAATEQALHCAKEAGCLVTYDPNYRPPLWSSLEEAVEQMLWGLGHADVVKLSEEELELLTGKASEEGVRYLQEQFDLQLVFVTLGSDGCLFANRSFSGYVPALKGLTVIDTTGAGDIFFGTAIARLLALGKRPSDLSEEELRDVTHFACTAAGLSTERSGGIPSVPTAEEVYRRMS